MFRVTRLGLGRSGASSKRPMSTTPRASLTLMDKRVALVVRFLSTPAGALGVQRRRKLEQIYAPFKQFEKGCPAYIDLAKSGRVWEDFFTPGDSKKLGYLDVQESNSSLLKEIDSYRNAISIPMGRISKSLVAEYAHQSVALEGNRLPLGQSVKIADKLEQELFNEIEMASLPLEELMSIPIPDLGYQQEKNDVAELTNHIIASLWISDYATSRPGTAGLSEMEVRQLSHLTNRGTAAEELHTKSWGKRISLGDYRSTPIGVKSNPIAIFPYPQEIPACMQRFFQWRDQVHQAKQLHPLIAACQGMLYFLSIHPFIDGNGRVGRMIMHDNMVRQGYLPVVMLGLERQDYLRMISDAGDGKPEELVMRVLMTELDELRTFKEREMVNEL